MADDPELRNRGEEDSGCLLPMAALMSLVSVVLAAAFVVMTAFGVGGTGPCGVMGFALMFGLILLVQFDGKRLRRRMGISVWTSNWFAAFLPRWLRVAFWCWVPLMGGVFVSGTIWLPHDARADFANSMLWLVGSGLGFFLSLGLIRAERRSEEGK